MMKNNGQFLLCSMLILTSIIGCGNSSQSNVNNIPPISKAGNNQIVNERTSVILEGTGTDMDGSIVNCRWQQVDGISVELQNANFSQASFIAPSINQSANLVFQLTVRDNVGAIANDQTQITVQAFESWGAITWNLDDWE